MKYCKKCNKRLDIREDFCPVCGTELFEFPDDADDEVNETEGAQSLSFGNDADIC